MLNQFQNLKTLTWNILMTMTQSLLYSWIVRNAWRIEGKHQAAHYASSSSVVALAINPHSPANGTTKPRKRCAMCVMAECERANDCPGAGGRRLCRCNHIEVDGRKKLRDRKRRASWCKEVRMGLESLSEALKWFPRGVECPD